LLNAEGGGARQEKGMKREETILGRWDTLGTGLTDRLL